MASVILAASLFWSVYSDVVDAIANSMTIVSCGITLKIDFMIYPFSGGLIFESSRSESVVIDQYLAVKSPRNHPNSGGLHSLN